MADRAIVSDPEIMNGTPCFAGTRVPFYLAGGEPLGEFLRQFPSVSREQAIQALEEAKESLFDLMVAPRASIKYWYCGYDIYSDEPRE